MNGRNGLPWQIFATGAAECPDGHFHARALASVVISPQEVIGGVVTHWAEWRLVQAEAEGSFAEDAIERAREEVTQIVGARR